MSPKQEISPNPFCRSRASYHLCSARVGDRPLPDWLTRHLRYTAVAMMPALVAPLVAWPAATDGQTDPARLLAAAATLGIGMLTKNVILAILSGAAALLAGAYLIG